MGHHVEQTAPSVVIIVIVHLVIEESTVKMVSEMAAKQFGLDHSSKLKALIVFIAVWIVQEM